MNKSTEQSKVAKATSVLGEKKTEIIWASAPLEINYAQTVEKIGGIGRQADGYFWAIFKSQPVMTGTVNVRFLLMDVGPVHNQEAERAHLATLEKNLNLAGIQDLIWFLPLFNRKEKIFMRERFIVAMKDELDLGYTRMYPSLLGNARGYTLGGSHEENLVKHDDTRLLVLEML